MERVRLNNRILVNKNWNCNEMTAGKISRHVSHQYNILQLKNKVWYIEKLVKVI